jgi:hypothetical protein
LLGWVVSVQFGGDGVAQLVPALLELGEAFAFELSGDVVEVDAGCCQLIQDAARVVVPARDGVAGQAMTASMVFFSALGWAGDLGASFRA